MKTKNTDVVAEYLHEVDIRLAGMPVLQRRELLADLAAHIAGERAERDLHTEGELIEVLERLGSPEVVAAAAHEEAGTRPAPLRQRPRWTVPVIAGVGALIVLVVLVLCAGMFFVSGSSTYEPQVVPTAPIAPSR